MSDTVTVWHPARDLAGHSREVAKADLDAWVEQGWLKKEPTEADYKRLEKAAESAQTAEAVEAN